MDMKHLTIFYLLLVNVILCNNCLTTAEANDVNQQQLQQLQLINREKRDSNSKAYYDKLRNCLRTSLKSDSSEIQCILKRMFRPLYTYHETKCKNCAK